LLRADSGFAREALMAWCENNGVDFLFGLSNLPSQGEGGKELNGAYAPFSPSRTAMGTVRLGSPKQASGSRGIQSLAEAPRVAPLASPSTAAAALRRQQLRVEARA
jgi:hypothetical protein